MVAPDGSNAARIGGLILGAAAVLLGLVGFVATGFTGFVEDTDEQLLGVFDLNVFHNVVHVAIGVGLIVASRARDVTITTGVVIGVGLFCIVAALLGFLNDLQILSINDPLAFANFFHLAVGVVALLFGLLGAGQQERAVRQEAWA